LKQAWVFPLQHTSNTPGSQLLLSMPNQSAVLALSEDFSKEIETAPETIHFDLTARTLATARLGDTIIQATESCIVLMNSRGGYV
jgi:hypothetical protein